MVHNQEQLRGIYTRAMALLSGGGADPSRADVQEACRSLEAIKDSSPVIAAQLAALHMLRCHEASNDKAAQALFLRAAMGGFPPAVRGLAVILLGQDASRGLGASLLRRAAQSGDWIAAFLLLREAGRGHIYAPAAELSALAARLSPAVPFFESVKQLNAAGDTPDIKTVPFSQGVCERALEAAFEAQPVFERTGLAKNPNVETLGGVLSSLECDYLVAVSSSLMQPSKVVDAEAATAARAQYRTSDGAVLLPASMDVVSALLQRKLSFAAGIPPENGEFITLLRYRPGQEYRPHHDFLEEDAGDYSKVKACGQRSHTLLTYLNEGYTGGKTAFPKLDISVKGARGQGLLFQNTAASGVPIQDSLHAGTPVTSGEKWLATLWCRERIFWPWLRD
ncbi:MAG: 2OG-Fe(II) oxygenase [Alphaproteobacteria bacterium]